MRRHKRRRPGYTGRIKRLVDSCYLLRHGADLMLWDTGLPAAMKRKPLDTKAPMDATVMRTVAEQLADLRIRRARIGISHYHFDQIGQAAVLPGATLLIGGDDWLALPQTSTRPSSSSTRSPTSPSCRLSPAPPSRTTS